MRRLRKVGKPIKVEGYERTPATPHDVKSHLRNPRRTKDEISQWGTRKNGLKRVPAPKYTDVRKSLQKMIKNQGELA